MYNLMSTPKISLILSDGEVSHFFPEMEESYLLISNINLFHKSLLADMNLVKTDRHGK